MLSDGASLQSLRRITLASSLGTFFEWYDFFLSATASAIIWPSVYFNFLSDPLALSLSDNLCSYISDAACDQEDSPAIQTRPGSHLPPKARNPLSDSFFKFLRAWVLPGNWQPQIGLAYASVERVGATIRLGEPILEQHREHATSAPVCQYVVAIPVHRGAQESAQGMREI